MTNLRPPSIIGRGATGRRFKDSTAPSYQPDDKLLRIVCMSDTHERYNQLMLNPTLIPEGDLLLHAGDMTFKGEYSKYTEMDDWLSHVRCRHKVIVPGNHDVTFETDWSGAVACFSNVDAFLNQSYALVSGLKIWGEPRQPWFYNWAFNVPRDQMRSVWEKVPTDVDVLLTHGPPLGIGDFTRGQHVGCEFQRKWIEEVKPKLVVCGHIHTGYGVYQLGSTMVVNASICNHKYQPVNAPIVVTLPTPFS